MLQLFLPLLLLLGPGPGSWSSAASMRSHVHRRGLLELAGTLECAGTHSPLAYITYGCFCGLGGAGQPRDTVDWCCHRHDCCYSRAEKAGCSPKMERYYWQCVNGLILCALFQGWMTCSPEEEVACPAQGQCVYCQAHALSPACPGPAENECQELLCKCDQEIAYCLARNEYNIKHLFYPRFLCGTNTPKCD